MTHSLILPLFTALSICATPAAAQTVGGGSEQLFRFNGTTQLEGFGGSVANTGDVNADGFDDFIVGASSADPNGISAAGSAFVYSGLDGSALYQFDGQFADDLFGFSVAGAGDVNADGSQDLIVGSIYSDPGGLLAAGSAFVYSGATGALLYRFDGTDSSDLFGYSVSTAGDVNADGYADLIVGAIGTGGLFLRPAGSSYVYSGADGSLLYQWNGQGAGDYFGNAVAAAGDVNADGFDDLIVGAYSASPGGLNDAGSAYVASGADGSLLYQWNGLTADDFFGSSVTGVGDLNGDGHADLVVGSARTSPLGTPSPGSAYAFSGSDGTILYQWDGATSFDAFGESVANAGDVDLDGVNDILVGAGLADSHNLTDNGSVMVYSGANGTLIQRYDGQTARDHLGGSVSGGGDSNGDGLVDLIFGASATDPGGVAYAGSAYVYSFHPYLSANAQSVSASNGGSLSFTLDFPTAAAFDEYKVLLSASGTGPTTYGVDIPLSQDSVVIDSFFGNYPVPNHSNMHGTLNASGQASASFTVPAGIPSALVGRTYYFAAIANQAGQLPEYSSIAVAIEITL